jgi:hypothetical protein
VIIQRGTAQLAAVRHSTWRPAIISATRLAGTATVCRQLLPADGRYPIEATLTHERYCELDLKSGQPVFERFRNARMFEENYSI